MDTPNLGRCRWRLASPFSHGGKLAGGQLRRPPQQKAEKGRRVGRELRAQPQRLTMTNAPVARDFGRSPRTRAQTPPHPLVRPVRIRRCAQPASAPAAGQQVLSRQHDDPERIAARGRRVSRRRRTSANRVFHHASVLRWLITVMATVPPDDTGLINLYLNQGSADPLMVACALDARNAKRSTSIPSSGPLSPTKGKQGKGRRIQLARADIRSVRGPH